MNLKSVKFAAGGRVRGWALLLGGFGGVQVLVQAIGFTSGLLLVRALDKEQYALFTFANTMLGTMVVLADAGISSGVSSIAGRVWGDPVRLGQLVRTALRLRLVLVIVVAVVLCPALAVWLSSRGVGVVSSSVITLLVAVTLYFQVGVGVLGFVPKILLQTKRLQFIDLTCSAVRLVLVWMACATILNADTALLAAALAAVLSWRLLVWLTAGDFRKDVEPDPVMRQEILGIVKRQAPNAIYFAVQSQIMVWLISIFGTTANLAEVGALSRLALIFGVINSIVAGLVLPRFARCHDAVTLKRRYLQIVSGFVVLGGLLVLLAALFPAQVLMILGPKYMHLQPQVVLMALGSAVAAVSGVMWRILQHEKPEDFVVATGAMHSLRDFVDKTFECLGLKAPDHVDADESLLRPSDITYSVGYAEKAHRLLGWKATVDFDDLIKRLVEAEKQSD